MRLQRPLAAIAVVCCACHHFEGSHAMEIGSLFDFVENNNMNPINEKNNIMVESGLRGNSDKDSSSSYQGGSDDSKSGYMYGKHTKGNDDDECCVCTCFDGNKDCHCDCSCGSKGKTDPTASPTPVPTASCNVVTNDEELRELIQDAIESGNEDTIILCPTEESVIFFAEQSPIGIPSGSTVKLACEESRACELNGDGESQFFVVETGATLHLQGLEMLGGSSNGFGGAILNDGGTLDITECLFDGNVATGGGAISTRAEGTVTVTDSAFTRNAAEEVGGAISVTGGTAIVTDSTFTTSTAGELGGAIFIGTNGNVELNGGLFQDNTIPADPPTDPPTISNIFVGGGTLTCGDGVNSPTFCDVRGIDPAQQPPCGTVAVCVAPP